MIKNLNFGDRVRIDEKIYIVQGRDEATETEYLYLEPEEFEFN